MKKIRKLIFIIILILIVAAAAFYTGTKWEGFIRSASPEVMSRAIEGKLSEIGELATMEYNYTNVASFENNLQLKNWNIPLTTKRFIVQYDGTIKAGIKIGEVSLKAEKKTITVTLPDIVILSHEIDENSLMVLDETKNIFNHITVDDYNSFSEEQKIICEENAIERGLLTDAQLNAQEIIRSIINSIPGSEAYEIVFK